MIEIGPVVLEKKNFKFCNFVIISPWKRSGPFIWTNFNPLHPRMLCAKFGWNGSVVLENFVNVFRYYWYLPLKKGGAFNWNKLESPSHKNVLCQVWLKLALWFWRRRFSNFVNVFSLLIVITGVSPWKKVVPFIGTNLNSPSHKSCVKFGWNRLNVFRYFVIISLWKRARLFIWAQLNPLYPRMPCAKFGWILLSG